MEKSLSITERYNSIHCQSMQQCNHLINRFFSSMIKKLQILNPIKLKGEQSIPNTRGSANQHSTIVENNKLYTDPIVFTNEQPYLAINVKQLLKTTTTYPLTLRLYSLARKMTYHISNKQQGTSTFVLPIALLPNKNGYRLKISDQTGDVLINSIVQTGTATQVHIQKLI